MELNVRDRLINKDIKKIIRQHKENIFSTKLKNNLTQFIMNYLDIKSKYEFCKTCIFIFNIFIDYENLFVFEKMKEKIQSKICKIYLSNHKKGIGYFCIIHFTLNKLIHALITNNNLIDESFLKNGKNSIKLSMNNNTESIEINLDNRIKFTNKDYDITIIQIFKEENKANDYFVLDYGLYFKNDINIYMLNNSKNEKLIVSIGEIQENNNFNEFNYISQTNNISPGTPILNISNNKIIGIHKGFNKEKNKNIGFFFNYFLEKNTYEEKDKQLIARYSSLKPKYIKRLPLELKTFNKEKIDNYIIYPIVENMMFLQTIIYGPADSPYENGTFLLDIFLTPDYPLKPPIFYFRTKIFHPNVKKEGSKI